MSMKTLPAKTATRAPRLMLPLMKLPLILYRLQLGWLLGHWFMRLTHIGRKSGKLRHTVLAVLRYDPTTREVMVVAPWRSSDWYHNICAAPACEVLTGRDRFAPQHRDLNAQEIAVLLEAYRTAHPIVGRIFCRIPGWDFNASPAEFLELARTLRGVAFRPG